MAVIDADAHVVENEHTWDYMRNEDREFRPLSVATTDPDAPVRRYWLIGDRSTGRAFIRNTNEGTGTSDESREMASVEARLAHMDELGVDIQVLYPTLFLRPLSARPEVDYALARSYNRWMADIWRMGRGRLRWPVIAPVYRLDQAIEEAHYGKEHGACGVYLRAGEAGLSLTDPYFFPLYEEASKLGMPICIHASNGNFGMWDQQENGLRFKLPPISVFHNLLMRRVPEKFPDLNWCFVEVSSQWVPYVMNDLSIRFGNSGREFPGAALMRENRMYVACQTTDDLEYVIETAGDDNIIIGTDYGHDDTSSEILAMQRLREEGRLAPSTVEKILDDNPRRLYGL
ncbi:MAG: amidohydrolase family protein [Chloroflexota bacterium]|nr:amidohydrolase family protein [Chloroflexota bacterium]MDE2883704.1 amidohydrolase family protein [Chloroflexota bacterium]